MSVIIIVGIIWGICKLISAASAASKERARQAEMARVRAAQERQRAEQARMREEWKAAQAAERERVRQMVALEKEQERQRIAAQKEAEKQAKLWAEQQKINRAVEERLFKLEQKLELAQREEEHWNDEATAIRVDMAGLEGYIKYCKSKGLLCKGKEEELKKKSKELYAAETKAIKARQARELCEKQMAA